MKTSATLSYLLYVASVALALPHQKRASGTSYDGGDTSNDITDGICAPVSFIFARGSTEAGNMGETVGPALAKALISALGNDGVAIQGVTYTASIESNVLLGSQGGPVMAQLAEKALSQCPSTKVIISGYSQGGEVCHYAVKSAGLSADDVTACVIYGDPENGSSVGSLPSSKLKEFCASGDGVCEGGGFDITAAHLSYTTNGDIQLGEEFIAAAVGSSNSSSSSGSSSVSAVATATSTATGTVASSSSTLSGLGSLSSLTSLLGDDSGDDSSLTSLLGGDDSSDGFNLTSILGGDSGDDLGDLSSLLGDDSGSSDDLGDLSSLLGDDSGSDDDLSDLSSLLGDDSDSDGSSLSSLSSIL